MAGHADIMYLVASLIVCLSYRTCKVFKISCTISSYSRFRDVAVNVTRLTIISSVDLKSFFYTHRNVRTFSRHAVKICFYICYVAIT